MNENLTVLEEMKKWRNEDTKKRRNEDRFMRSFLLEGGFLGLIPHLIDWILLFIDYWLDSMPFCLVGWTVYLGFFAPLLGFLALLAGFFASLAGLFASLAGLFAYWLDSLPHSMDSLPTGLVLRLAAWTLSYGTFFKVYYAMVYSNLKSFSNVLFRICRGRMVTS